MHSAECQSHVVGCAISPVQLSCGTPAQNPGRRWCSAKRRVQYIPSCWQVFCQPASSIRPAAAASLRAALWTAESDL